MPLIKVLIELCEDCHYGQTEEMTINTPRKYYESAVYECSNCGKALVATKTILVGYLNAQ